MCLRGHMWGAWAWVLSPTVVCGAVAKLVCARGRVARCLHRGAHLLWEAGAGDGVVLQVLPAAAVPVLDGQVDGHLPLEAGDVAVTEVVAQVVDLGGHRGTGGATRGPGPGAQGGAVGSACGGGRAGGQHSPSPAPAGGTGAPGWPGSSEPRRRGGNARGGGQVGRPGQRNAEVEAERCRNERNKHVGSERQRRNKKRERQKSAQQGTSSCF